MLNKTRFTLYFISLLFYSSFFIFLYSLLNAYEFGDQIPYRLFYEQVNKASISEILILGRLYLSSSEPLSLVTYWVGSNFGIDKDLFFSFINLVFVIYLVNFLRRYNVSYFIILCILFNYYLIVLFTSAERLKLAFLAIIMALNHSGRLSFLLLASSFLFHFQSILFLPIFLIHKFFFDKKFLLLNKKNIFFYFISFVILLFIIYTISPFLIDKAESYISNSRGFVEIFKGLVLLFLGTFLFRGVRFPFVFSLLFLLAFALLLGDSRINIMIFFTFLYYAVCSFMTNSLLFLSVVLYFLVNAFIFMYNIYMFGDGFVL